MTYLFYTQDGKRLDYPGTILDALKAQVGRHLWEEAFNWVNQSGWGSRFTDAETHDANKIYKTFLCYEGMAIRMRMIGARE